MLENNTTPETLVPQSEVNCFETQMKIVFAAFKPKPATMLMVAKQTGIERANICRYVAIWIKQGKIHLGSKSLCRVSKRLAGYYTTNKNFFTSLKKTC